MLTIDNVMELTSIMPSLEYSCSKKQMALMICISANIATKTKKVVMGLVRRAPG